MAKIAQEIQTIRTAGNEKQYIAETKRRMAKAMKAFMKANS